MTEAQSNFCLNVVFYVVILKLLLIVQNYFSYLLLYIQQMRLNFYQPLFFCVIFKLENSFRNNSVHDLFLNFILGDITIHLDVNQAGCKKQIIVEN